MKSNSTKSQGKDKIVYLAISSIALILSLVNIVLMVHAVKVDNNTYSQMRMNAGTINQLVKCQQGDKKSCDNLEQRTIENHF